MNVKGLSGFPMVLAVSEHAINQDMARVFGQQRTNQSTFPKVPWVLKESKGKWTVNIDEFYAPEVDFNTPVKNGCRLKMQVKHGNLTYYSLVEKDGEMTAEKRSQNLDELTFYVVTPMRSIEHEQWSDEDFQVQAIFMDLSRISKIDLINTSEKIEVDIGAFEVGLANIIKKQLEQLAEDDPEAVMFGAVKIPRIQQKFKTKGPLKPTAFTYSTYKHIENKVYRSGDLNFLLMLDDDELPTGNVGNFSQSFVLPGNGISLAVSGGTMLEKFVLPTLKLNFGYKCRFKVDHGSIESGTPATATLSENVTLNNPDNIKKTTLRKCDVKCEGEGIKVDYEILFVVDHWAGDEKVTATGTIDIHYQNVNGKITQEINASELDIVKRDFDWWGRIFSNILTLGFNEWGRWATMTDAFDSIEDFNNQFDDAFNEVFASFMRPGKAVLKYSGDISFQAVSGLSSGADYQHDPAKMLSAKKNAPINEPEKA
ncbi:hypothetical protein [Photobacterium atrarenae]|uniref:Uncharacterized protein n=1 Tax=Photobacterium atrarenae TaxID=865757 RepID=A0ABY5GC43_9GAMM|nr:hypothetical protein [Photobacterium atrarenae]UTV26669.1 hypothetical protein NNL38_09865 [Photobacterium atrarenae]